MSTLLSLAAYDIEIYVLFFSKQYTGFPEIYACFSL